MYHNTILKDENDITPAFTMGSYNASIREDIPPGSSVIQVEAVDQDTGEFGRLIYSIINVVRPTSPNGSFVIDDETGIISTFERFDRELFAGTYVVNVRCNLYHVVLDAAPSYLCIHHVFRLM